MASCGTAVSSVHVLNLESVAVGSLSTASFTTYSPPHYPVATSGRQSKGNILLVTIELGTRLGLNVHRDQWPTAPLLDSYESSGFSWVQIHTPPRPMLADRECCRSHARALRAALAPHGLRLLLHGPDGLSAGTLHSDVGPLDARWSRRTGPPLGARRSRASDVPHRDTRRHGPRTPGPKGARPTPGPAPARRRSRRSDRAPPARRG
jgi:hypothetical protein